MWVYPEIASMADLTRYHARARGDALALWFGQNKLSWRDFDSRASRDCKCFHCTRRFDFWRHRVLWEELQYLFGIDVRILQSGCAISSAQLAANGA